MKKYVLIFLLAGFAAAFAANQKMWIAIDNAPVKSSTWFFASTTAKLAYATQVTQTKTSGKWSYITAGNVKGWVATASLSKRKLVAKGSNFSANADELALAGKGFNSEVEKKYKKSGKVNYDAVDAMESLTVSEEELFEFIKEGKLKGAQE